MKYSVNQLYSEGSLTRCWLCRQEHQSSNLLVYTLHTNNDRTSWLLFPCCVECKAAGRMDNQLSDLSEISFEEAQVLLVKAKL